MPLSKRFRKLKSEEVSALDLSILEESNKELLNMITDVNKDNVKKTDEIKSLKADIIRLSNNILSINTIIISSVEPSNPSINTLWIDTSV